jgi:diadenosine tetraphosphate (Ap4A) HIT family hydrolase
MSPFTLHPQLEADSVLIRELPLCQLRLNNQKTFPWLILVPRRDGMQEIAQLKPADRALLIEEITQASNALTAIYKPDKINIGALGNVVPQLHIHVIARFKNDEAWPHPVWGRFVKDAYTANVIEKTRGKLNDDNYWR